jgi:hypothetical protein
MTEDFASDMYLLRDLLLLAQNNGHAGKPEWNELNRSLIGLEQQATRLMESVQELKQAFNPANRDLMMGLWIASFVDPVDPPNGETPPINEKLTEADLIDRAKKTGGLLNELFDALKAPHRVAGDRLPQGADLQAKIDGVSALVDLDLNKEYRHLGENLEKLIGAFQKTGGGGGQSTYWPSNYVSSSSSSSSSTTYP